MSRDAKTPIPPPSQRNRRPLRAPSFRLLPSIPREADPRPWTLCNRVLQLPTTDEPDLLQCEWCARPAQVIPIAVSWSDGVRQLADPVLCAVCAAILELGPRLQDVEPGGTGHRSAVESRRQQATGIVFDLLAEPRRRQEAEATLDGEGHGVTPRASGPRRSPVGVGDRYGQAGLARWSRGYRPSWLQGQLRSPPPPAAADRGRARCSSRRGSDLCRRRRRGQGPVGRPTRALRRVACRGFIVEREFTGPVAAGASAARRPPAPARFIPQVSPRSDGSASFW